MKSPRVSVVLPFYNAGRYIERAVHSVVVQSYPHLELILVDDCSTDQSLERATSLAKVHQADLKVVSTEANSGPSAARNKGIAAATGDYIAFLDADDFWRPEKLARQIELMERHPEMNLCGCQALLVNEEDGSSTQLFENIPEVQADGMSELFWNCYIATPCALVRASALPDQPFDESLRIGEDRDLWIRLSSAGPVGLIQEPMVEILVRKASYSRDSSALIEVDVVPMIERHLQTFADRLHPSTRKRAYGKLYWDIGAGRVAANQWAEGAGFLMKAAMRGFRPVRALRLAVMTSPPIQPIKLAIKRAIAPARPQSR